ncbi:hypothetical protein A9Q99_27305 [Gammaproteobacteria bacterium 45_16_T64]|nr:hypothetical protein A9Q99_27305 [Gammaproteobacteria bacterium 45_16_T64]
MKRHIYISFAAQISIISICLITITALYFGYQSYHSEAARKEKSLANELISIVKTASTQLNVNAHEEIFFDPDEGLEGEAEFHDIRAILGNIRDINSLEHDNGSPVYTLRQPFDFEETGHVEFVVMSDVNSKGLFYTGARLKAEPIHIRAFSGESSVTGVYSDSEGDWISAAAPLFLDGEVVGIIQADRTVGFYFEELLVLRNQYFFIGAICLLTGIVFSLLFAVYATRPLKVLLSASKKFGDGEYGYRITDRRIDDFDEVFLGFNEMALNVQTEHEENVQINDERRQLNEKLSYSLEEIEKALAVKNEFLANMSHEIRTPMNSIMGFTQILMDSKLPAKQHALLQRVDGSSRNLMRIVSQILDLSKIEAGKMELDEAEYDLNKELIELIMMNAEAAKENNINLLLFVNKPLPIMLFGDGMRTSQIILNLLSNGVKFTHSGYVSLTVDWTMLNSEDIELSFVIQDTGIGVSESASKRIFEPFTQADASISKSYGGTGLGLTIARNISTLMAGEVVFDSEDGSGAKFTATVVQRVLKNVPIPDENSAAFARYQSINPTNQRYLLVDECLEVGRQLATWLGKENVDQVTSVDLLESSLKNTRKPFDYIILDYFLAEYDIKLVKWLLGQCDHEGVQLVAMTAIDNVSEALVKEANYLITKPLILDDVVRSLNGTADLPRYCTIDEYPAIQLKEEVSISTTLLKRKHVLLVEDNPDNELLATMLLDEYGVSYSVARDGKEAVEILRESEFDLVLMDLQMPVMDGISATEIIKSEKEICHVPVVAMTANTTPSDQKKCMDVGMEEVLSKPVDKDYFVGLLDRYLSTESSGHLLLVDDDASNQMLVGLLLEKYGVSYDVANNGSLAVDMVKGQRYDMVLMDMTMPVMDGLTATKLIKENTQFSALPVVAMTGFSDKARRQECVNAGMVDYVGKPIKTELLYAVLDRYLRSSSDNSVS